MYVMHQTGELSSVKARLITLDGGPESNLSDNKVLSEIQSGEKTNKNFWDLF